MHFSAGGGVKNYSAEYGIGKCVPDLKPSLKSREYGFLKL